MTTYAQLQTDIEGWLIANDLTATIPTWIVLGEERIKWGVVGDAGRRSQEKGAVRVRNMERRARAVGNGTPYLPFPPNMLEHRRMQFTGSTQRDRDLDYVGAENMSYSANQRPTRYTIEREEFEFNGSLPDTLEVEILYYEPYAALANPTDTNWLLTNAYGVYLFAALCEGNIHTQDDERQSLLETEYAGRVRALMDSEHRARRTQGPRSVRLRGRSTP